MQLSGQADLPAITKLIERRLHWLHGLTLLQWQIRLHRPSGSAFRPHSMYNDGKEQTGRGGLDALKVYKQKDRKQYFIYLFFSLAVNLIC